jgi:S-adenosylmethionine synthetase
VDGWNAVGTGLSRTSPPEVIKLDILDSHDIHRVLADVEPHVVVHCAANRFPDSCTADPKAAEKINVDASRALAEATIARGIFLIYISTDYVFSGRPGEAPYQPTSAPNPPNVYVSPQTPHLQLFQSAPELSKPEFPNWQNNGKPFADLFNS